MEKAQGWGSRAEVGCPRGTGMRGRSVWSGYRHLLTTGVQCVSDVKTGTGGEGQRERNNREDSYPRRQLQDRQVPRSLCDQGWHHLSQTPSGRQAGDGDKPVSHRSGFGHKQLAAQGQGPVGTVWLGKATPWNTQELCQQG